MTEAEREGLIEAMALWMERRKHGLRFDIASDDMLACARAALEVAEPVILEQCAEIAAGEADTRINPDHTDKRMDEINRLREENARLREEYGPALDTLVAHDAVCAENEALRAENARLRETLQQFARRYDDITLP